MKPLPHLFIVGGLACALSVALTAVAGERPRVEEVRQLREAGKILPAEKFVRSLDDAALAADLGEERTVEVEAFCSWSACRTKIRSMALANTGLIGLISHGVLNIMCRKFSE